MQPDVLQCGGQKLVEMYLIKQSKNAEVYCEMAFVLVTLELLKILH